MTTLTITICSDNDAFVDNEAGEISRILSDFVYRLNNDGNLDESTPLRDINGNIVGYAELDIE